MFLEKTWKSSENQRCNVFSFFSFAKKFEIFIVWIDNFSKDKTDDLEQLFARVVIELKDFKFS